MDCRLIPKLETVNKPGTSVSILFNYVYYVDFGTF